MKFGTFLFTNADDKTRDHLFIEETLADARESEELGMDAVWLAEHHFDGTLAYVDPVSFAAALSTATKRIKIGTAVIQAALHHPLRVAAQLALIDHLSQGRLIAGVGKGTLYNPYEYEAYGVDQETVSERYEEFIEILLKAWTGERVVHHGKFWNFEIPAVRPLPYTKPHPVLVRATQSESSVVAQAKTARPFLMMGSDDMIKKNVELVKTTMHQSGYDEAKIADTLDQSWMRKIVTVADSDAEAEDVIARAIADTLSFFERENIPSSFIKMRHGENRVPPFFVHGKPETVAEKLRAAAATGIGGMILHFRYGVMPHAAGRNSLHLFAKHVAPALRSA